MIRKDHVFKTLMLSRKGTVEKPADVNDPLRFAGDGITFRAKLIGVLEVTAPRGDRLCQEALAELKMAIKAAGEHKQRILICVALDGLRLRDERTGDCLYHHAVHKISFIAQDITDPRAFGYIFGSPDQGHRFYGIKTDKPANMVVMAMRDLFQVVYDLKKKDLDRVKQFAPADSGKTNGTSHLRDSMDSLDQMLSLGSHFGATSDTPPIQTADLLNLSAEEHFHSPPLPPPKEALKEVSLPKEPSFDPFDDVTDPFAQVPFHKTLATLPPPKSKSAKSNFPEKFSDSFMQTPSLAPPPKSPNMKISAQQLSRDSYATVRPRKKSDDALPPLLAKSPAAKKLSGDRLSSLSASAIPRPSSGSSSNPSPLPNVLAADPFDSQPFPVNFPSAADSASNPVSSSPASVDVFAELDPLGTGKIKPYVDKKDFFQDLRKTTPKKPLTSETPDILRTDKTDTFPADPFGSVQPVVLPEPDPFDTKFADFRAPPVFFPAPPVPSSVPVLPPPLKVILPLAYSDSDSEVSSLTSRRRKSPPQTQVQSSRSVPVPSQEKNSSSEAESSSSEDHSDQEASTKAPEPPPRPPVLKPPPLPPKGQQPVIPQRPGISPPPPVDPSGLRTPPLPVPSRRQKPAASAARTSREEGTKKTSGLKQISLLQLSSMSLAELADTLRLPPARLACMTLTELALRLAELNKELEAKEDEEEEEEEPPEEEEEEARTIQEDDKTEVCYKGGKLYEILSDAHEEEEEEEEEAGREAESTPETANQSNPVSEDKYAALREIMELELNSRPTSVQKEEILPQFADFDSMKEEFQEAGQNPQAGIADPNPDFEQTVQNPPSSLGFEDNFSTKEEEDLFASKGARPKIPVKIQSEEDEEFADKFAAFEARFPENPVEGFADSFANFEAPQADPSPPPEEKKPVEGLTVPSNVKKSQSVNIFQTVEDPFDDDFFQESDPEPVTRMDNVKSKPELTKMATIVEDPFAWVQPFDDNFEFDEEYGT